MEKGFLKSSTVNFGASVHLEVQNTTWCHTGSITRTIGAERWVQPQEEPAAETRQTTPAHNPQYGTNATSPEVDAEHTNRLSITAVWAEQVKLSSLDFRALLL